MFLASKSMGKSHKTTRRVWVIWTEKGVVAYLKVKESTKHKGNLHKAGSLQALFFG